MSDSGGFVSALMQGNQAATVGCNTDHRSSEQIMVDMIRTDIGVVIEPQAWRMFLRHRFDRMSTLAHRIHDGKR